MLKNEARSSVGVSNNKEKDSLSMKTGIMSLATKVTEGDMFSESTSHLMKKQPAIIQENEESDQSLMEDRNTRDRLEKELEKMRQ